jgi:hypothetical protein
MIRQDGTPTDLVSVTSDESPANSIGASSITRLVFLPECGFHIPENPTDAFRAGFQPVAGPSVRHLKHPVRGAINWIQCVS